LQGRRAYDGATVKVTDAISAVTDTDGNYVLSDIPAGSVTVTVRMSGYLEAVRPGVAISDGVDLALPDLTLRGGDPNGDCSPPRDGRADLNRDGKVDLQDLLLVTLNLWQRCPSTWTP
jgi:hypothetical protein